MKTTCSLALMIAAGAILITATPLRAATDTSINNEIFHQLLNDRLLALGTHKITITTRNGMVTLNGDVPTQTDKQQLHDAIAGLPGVQRVNDKQLILQHESPAAPPGIPNQY